MHNDAPDAVANLSPRERQILGLAAKGLTDKEIGMRLGVSLTTVRTYWERLREKTGAINRAQSVALFVGSEAIPPDFPERPLEPSTLMQAVMEATVGGILILDFNGTIQEVNEKACSLLEDTPKVCACEIFEKSSALDKRHST